MIAEFRLERLFARWEFRARHLISASDCETLSIGELLALAGLPAQALLDLRLGYRDSQGDPALRARIATFYPGLEADDILVTNAPEEAIFLAMTALLPLPCAVVVQTPCYQSLEEIARGRGCEVRRWPLVETDAGWRLDLDALEALLPGAALLVVNAPHNPTGFSPTPAEHARVLELAAGARVFFDEMYRGLEGASPPLPPAASVDERALSLWGMSKSFGLPGLRIGWLALRDRDLLGRLLRLKDYTTICASGPGEWLAGIGLEQAAALFARNRAIVNANLARARAFAGRRPDLLAWREPVAGPLAFPRLVPGGAARFCEELVQRTGVMLVPSTVFDAGDAHVRLGFGRRDFADGLAVLEM